MKKTLALLMVLASPAMADYTLPGATAFELSHPGFLPATVEPAPSSFFDRVSDLDAMHIKMRDARYVGETSDTWAISWVGDCEDLALAAMSELRANGWPVNSLHLMIRPPLAGEKRGHAILCAWISKSGPLCIDRFTKPTLLERMAGKWSRAEMLIER